MFFPRAHTFSIVARAPITGEFGVAVQSHWFNVGRLVAWARSGVGAVATQASCELSYGPKGLELMAQGVAPIDALAQLLAEDEGRELRQVAMVDAQGRVAAHTGSRCIAEAGHRLGDGFSVQANIMVNDTVWPAMARAYERADGDLAERLLAALRAGQKAGGDLRGQQSAAMLIVPAEASEKPWEDVVMDLRVEDHVTPIEELARLVMLHRAYDRSNRGDELMAKGDLEGALAEYRTSAQIAPYIAELPFWQAVTLADIGRLDEALPLFADVFTTDPNLAIMVQRLPASGLLRDDPEMMTRILQTAPSP